MTAVLYFLAGLVFLGATCFYSEMAWEFASIPARRNLAVALVMVCLHLAASVMFLALAIG